MSDLNTVAMSDSNGYFAFNSLPKGKIRLSFSTFGFDKADTTFNIESANINDVKWTITTNCKLYNREKALQDIKSGHPKLFVRGGDPTIIYSGDRKFKKKYKIEFGGFGCIPPDMDECLDSYNEIIILYLDKKYGKKWRQEIRDDVRSLESGWPSHDGDQISN